MSNNENDLMIVNAGSHRLQRLWRLAGITLSLVLAAIVLLILVPSAQRQQWLGKITNLTTTKHTHPPIINSITFSSSTSLPGAVAQQISGWTEYAIPSTRPPTFQSDTIASFPDRPDHILYCMIASNGQQNTVTFEESVDNGHSWTVHQLGVSFASQCVITVVSERIYSLNIITPGRPADSACPGRQLFTDDGGSTWHEFIPYTDLFGPDAFQFCQFTISPSAWYLFTSPSNGGTVHVPNLWQSRDHGKHWQSMTLPKQYQGTNGSGAYYITSIANPALLVAYVFDDLSAGQSGPSHIYISRDDARTWISWPFPDAISGSFDTYFLDHIPSQAHPVYRVNLNANHNFVNISQSVDGTYWTPLPETIDTHTKIGYPIGSTPSGKVVANSVPDNAATDNQTTQFALWDPLQNSWQIIPAPVVSAQVSRTNNGVQPLFSTSELHPDRLDLFIGYPALPTDPHIYVYRRSFP